MRLDIGQDDVGWVEWRWDSGYEPSEPIDFPGRQVSFDRTQYEEVLLGAYEQIAAFPFDELNHRGRRFLWPWQWGWRMPSG